MSKNKNYFRHFFKAHRDAKMIKLKKTRGTKGIGEYWILIELCAEFIHDNTTGFENVQCVFHERNLRESLSLRKQELNKCLTSLQLIFNFSWTRVEDQIFLSVPNLSKYFGKYSEQKDIGKERKGKEIQGEEQSNPRGSDPVIDESSQKQNKSRKKSPTKKDPDNQTQKLYAHYCEEFKKLYKINPPRTGKDIGLIKNCFSSMPLEDGLELITAYFQSKENWFKTKGHDMATLANNLTKLKVNTVEIKKQREKKENLFDTIDAIQSKEDPNVRLK